MTSTPSTLEPDPHARVRELAAQCVRGTVEWRSETVLVCPASLEALLSELDTRTRERDEAVEALTKIDAIRNSIIGCQKVNWSEHVYPLVAALNDAGFPGLGYAECRDNVGTLIERTNAAEALLKEAGQVLEPFAKVCAAEVYECDSDGSKLAVRIAFLRAAANLHARIVEVGK